MYMSFDTNELTAGDKQVLAMLAENLPVTSSPSTTVEEPVTEPVEPTPAPKPAPAKKTTPAKPEPVKEEPVVEPEPEVEEDLVGGTEPEPEGPTMADAVAAATKLVSSGGAKQVKEALAAVGAKRVSEVPEDKISEFLAALNAS